MTILRSTTTRGEHMGQILAHIGRSSCISIPERSGSRSPENRWTIGVSNHLKRESQLGVERVELWKYRVE